MNTVSRGRPSLFVAAATSALILGTAASSPAHASPVSDVIVFGDSSSDLGSEGPPRRPTNQGQMWSERFAEAIGRRSTLAREFRLNAAGDGIDIIRSGGNNYAVNGSTALPFDCCLTLEQQVDFFVSDRGRFRGDELVFVWLTRNDITTALPDGLPYSAALYADAVTDQIERLRGLGARNLVVFGTETGLLAEQFALDNGASPEQLAVLRQETILAEAALWPRLQQNDVFVIDLDRLGDDIIANPSKYGFQFTTDNYQLRDAYLAGGGAPIDDSAVPNDGNVFTVDGHYTSAMQAVVADFTSAQLRAREQFASTLVQTGLSFRLARDAALGLRMSDAGRGWTLYAAPVVGRLDQEGGSALDAELNETYAGLTLGGEMASAEGARFGGGLTLGRRDASFDQDRGSIESAYGLATGFVEVRATPWLALEANGSVGAVSFDQIERQASLGSTARARAKGGTDGMSYSAGVRGRSTIPVGAWLVSGAAGVTFERTEISGYAERDSVLSLHYGDSAFDAVLSSLDLRVTRADPEIRLQPYGSLSITHDFMDDPIAVEVGPTANMIVTYETARTFETAVGGELGFDTRLGSDMALRTSLTHQMWFGDEADASASAFRVALVKAF